MAKIKWDLDPHVINEDGSYDSVGATLNVAMKQAQALGDIATALNRIATELRYARAAIWTREYGKAGDRDGKEAEGAV